MGTGFRIFPLNVNHYHVFPGRRKERLPPSGFPNLPWPRAGFPLQSMETPVISACREIHVKLHRSSCFFTALMVAGALTFLLSLARRERILSPLPYSVPTGGEREGEFELFIGS